MLAQIYVYDVDGRRVLLPAPEEKRERRVVEDGPNGRVSEEIVERRDANGNKLPPEKLRVVEKQGADGATIVETKKAVASQLFKSISGRSRSRTMPLTSAGLKKSSSMALTKPPSNGWARTHRTRPSASPTP